MLDPFITAGSRLRHRVRRRHPGDHRLPGRQRQEPRHLVKKLDLGAWRLACR